MSKQLYPEPVIRLHDCKLRWIWTVLNRSGAPVFSGVATGKRAALNAAKRCFTGPYSVEVSA